MTVLDKERYQKTNREDNITALYVGLTYIDSASQQQSWLPIVRISWDTEGYYYYSFTKGFAQKYQQLKGHVLNPKRGYSQVCKDRNIPYFLKNRIPRRADSMKLYNLFGLKDRKGDFIALLARDGGKIIGDNYDIFPEITPDKEGVYRFYWTIEGLATLIGNGSKTAKNLAEQIKAGDKLELELTQGNRTRIKARGIFIGYAPNYINYLLRNNQHLQYKLEANLINQEESRYAYRILVRLEFSNNQYLFQEKSFQPINVMEF